MNSWQRVAALLSAAALTGCDFSHTSVTSAGADPGAGTVRDLRLTAGAGGPPVFRLHWAYTGTAQPSGFQVCSGAVPIDADNHAEHVIATVAGDARSATVDIPADAGLRYLAVRAVVPSPLALSRNLQLDTDTQLAVISQSPTGNSLHIVRPDRAAPAAVATNVEVHGWTPGSRALTYVDILEGTAHRYRPDRPPVDPTLLSRPASVPDGIVGRRWTSMRVSSTGDVAYHRPDGDGNALEVRRTDRTTVRVSGPGEDVLQFSWSPDGRWLMYHVPGTAPKYGLRLVRADGTDRVRVDPALSADEYVFLADWSPDCRNIAFQVLDARHASVGTLYVRNVWSGRTTKISSDVDIDVVWSPDGREILFSGPGDNNNRALYRQQVPGDTTQPTEDVMTLVTSATDILGFSYSPDGARIAWFRRTGPATKALGVLSAHDPRISYDVTLPFGESALRTAWSADSRSLACLVQRAGGQALRVFDLSAAGPAQSTVWAEAPVFGHFEWSPTGRHLGLIARDGATFKVYVTTGAALIDLTPDPSPARAVLDFRWSDWALPRRTWIFSPQVIY